MSFKRFDPEDVVISAESVTAPAWSGDTTTLVSFYTSSTQTLGTSGNYYYNVYHQDPEESATEDTAKVQFSVTYADKDGYGSNLYTSGSTTTSGKSYSSTVYGQYRNLVLGDEDSDFTFGTVTSDYFYVVSIDRARYKEKLLPGTLELILSSSNGSLTLTDDSNLRATVSYTDSGRVYELVSGSVGTVHTGSNSNGYHPDGSGSYGKFLPDVGVLLLNGKALDSSGDYGLTLGTDRSENIAGSTNLDLIFSAISTGASFKLRSEETISSNFVFVRARNSEFNYSTNPSLITGSGEIRHSIMINSPQSYITTVGLYNDNNDCLAVAKLSKPLVKDFTKEALIRIKLNY